MGDAVLDSDRARADQIAPIASAGLSGTCVKGRPRPGCGRPAVATLRCAFRRGLGCARTRDAARFGRIGGPIWHGSRCHGHRCRGCAGDAWGSADLDTHAPRAICCAIVAYIALAHFVAPDLGQLFPSRAAAALVHRRPIGPTGAIAITGCSEPSLIFLLGTTPGYCGLRKPQRRWRNARSSLPSSRAAKTPMSAPALATWVIRPVPFPALIIPTARTSP